MLKETDLTQSIKNNLEASWLKAIVKNGSETQVTYKKSSIFCDASLFDILFLMPSNIHAFFSVQILLKAAVQASMLCLSLISHRYNKDTLSKTNAPAYSDAFITVQSAVTDLILSYHWSECSTWNYRSQFWCFGVSHKFQFNVFVWGRLNVIKTCNTHTSVYSRYS